MSRFGAVGLVLVLLAGGCGDDPPASPSSIADLGDVVDEGYVADEGVRDLGTGGVPDAAEPPDTLDCGELSRCGRLCVDVDGDPDNCGQCGRTCLLPNAESGCMDGQCIITACLPYFFDQDNDPETGCEVENRCDAGAPCETECGSVGAVECDGDTGVCVPPSERCNAVDDDCDGACDEGPIPGCRVAVHRGFGRGHVYTSDLAFVSTDPFRLEAQNYFYLYTEPASEMRPVFFCPAANDRYLLSSANNCETPAPPIATLGFWSPMATCGGQPLYRMFSAGSGDHFYTTSEPERDNAIGLGYEARGIAGYIWTDP